MTPAKRNLHVLAENLGMMVADIQQRMLLSEYMDWMEFYQKDAKDAESDEDEVDDDATSADDLMRAFGIVDRKK